MTRFNFQPRFPIGRVVSVANNFETIRTEVQSLKPSHRAEISRIKLGLSILLAACLSLTGCGKNDLPKRIPIRGTVVFKDGSPLRSGQVVYSPVDKTKGRPAYGRIDEKGSFVMEATSELRGVLPGEYQIAILAYAEPAADGADGSKRKSYSKTAPPPVKKPLIPERYLNANHSGLVDTVSKSHSGVKNIELDKE